MARSFSELISALSTSETTSGIAFEWFPPLKPLQAKHLSDFHLWNRYRHSVWAISICETTTGVAFERFWPIVIRVAFESTLAFSASAFDRFGAAVAIRSDFESIFRSIRWAISDRPKQVFRSRKVSKSNETGKHKKVVEEFRNREAQVC